MNKLKVYMVALLGLLMGVQVYAHDNYNYLNITLGGGLHTMRHTPMLGNSKLGAGGVFNVNYIRFFGDHFGLGTGLGVSYNQSRSIIDGTIISLEQDAYNGNQAYEFRMIYDNWEEVQRSVVAELPLGFYGRLDIKEKTSFFVGVGGKLTFPFIYRYETVDGSIETRGYYSSTNVEIFDLPHHGFGVNNTNYFGSTDSKLGFSIFLDLGMNHWLKENLALYWGLYCNYGITNISKSNTADLYDVEENYAGVHGSNMIEKASLFSAGVKIGVTIPFGKKPLKIMPDSALQPDSALEFHELVLVAPDTIVPDSMAVEVASMIEKLPDWENFNYRHKDELKKVTDAFAALSVDAKQDVPQELREKMFGLNVNVNKSTIENLEQSLKIKKSYGFSLSSSSGHFSEKEKEYMRYVADCLKMNPEAKVSVVGYTCDLGTKMINEELGFDRAIHVRNYLIRYGAFEEQVEMDSRSTQNPVAPNTSEKNREKNRRTEIKLIKKK